MTRGNAPHLCHANLDTVSVDIMTISFYLWNLQESRNTKQPKEFVVFLFLEIRAPFSSLMNLHFDALSPVITLIS
jgi:hypothetical protein